MYALDRTCTLSSSITETLLCALPEAQPNARCKPCTFDSCIHRSARAYLLHNFRIRSTLAAVRANVRDFRWRSYISDIISAMSLGESSCSVMVLQDAMSLMSDLQQPQAKFNGEEHHHPSMLAQPTFVDVHASPEHYRFH